MAEYKIRCLYCDYKGTEYAYNDSGVRSMICPRCKSKARDLIITKQAEDLSLCIECKAPLKEGDQMRCASCWEYTFGN